MSPGALRLLRKSREKFIRMLSEANLIPEKEKQQEEGKKKKVAYS